VDHGDGRVAIGGGRWCTLKILFPVLILFPSISAVFTVGSEN
jgi:hypothetical protein